MGNCMSSDGVEEGKSTENKPTGAPADKENANPNRRKDPKGSSAMLVNGVYVFGYRTDLEKCYAVTSKVLGKGSYGTVLLGTSHATGEQVAVKRIRKDKLTDEVERHDLELEVDVMNRIGIGSLNCIWLLDTFEDSRYVYLVMELADGGTLLNRILDGGFQSPYKEEDVARVALSVLRTLAQCHAKHVIYRDIKPENFVYKSNARDSKLKAIDFGLAVYHPPGSPDLKDITGTPYFMAPEVVRKNYSFECDVWSAGVLLYLLLTGRRPFNGKLGAVGTEQTYSVLRDIVRSPVPWGSAWDGISDSCRDLISRMLEKDRYKRIKLEEALEHPWVLREVKEPDQHDTRLDLNVVSRLQRYATYGAFKQQAMVTILKQRRKRSVAEGSVAANSKKNQSKSKLEHFIETDPMMNNLLELFNRLDLDKTGGIDFNEAKKGLFDAGYQMSDEEVEHIWRVIDVGHSGKVDLDEFLAAMTDWSTLESRLQESDSTMYDVLLEEVFQIFDTDNSGQLNVDEVSAVLNQHSDSAAVRAVFNNVDSDGDGLIDFGEFKQIMLDNKNDNLKFYDMRLRKHYQPPPVMPERSTTPMEGAKAEAEVPVNFFNAATSQKHIEKSIKQMDMLAGMIEE